MTFSISVTLLFRLIKKNFIITIKFVKFKANYSEKIFTLKGYKCHLQIYY